MLMKVREYIETTFTPASAPDPEDVIQWIKKKQIYGVRLGKYWYVDPDINLIEAKNDLVMRVLRTG